MQFPRNGFFLASPVLPPLEQLIEKGTDPGVDGASDRAAEGDCDPAFLLRETQWEIAKFLGVSQPVVSQTLMAALRRMREGQREILSRKRAGSGRCAV